MKPYKAVIFFGSKSLRDKHGISKKIINPDEVLVIGDGQLDDISTAIKKGLGGEDSKGRKYETIIDPKRINPDTIAIISGHGINDEDQDERFHTMDGEETAEIDKTLKKLGFRKRAYFLCHVGTLLREEKKQAKELKKQQEEDTIMAFSSSAYSTLTEQANSAIGDLVTEIQKDQSSADEALKKIARNHPETVYLKYKGTIEKSSRPGKFELPEVRTILSSLTSEEKKIQKIISALEKTGKQNFSIHGKNGIDKFIDQPDTEFSASFIKALEDKLVEKLSYIEIIKYLHNRFKETDEKKDEELSEKIAAWERSQSMTQELRELNYKYYPESAELFMLAVSRLNFEVVKAMISICPSISDIDDNATNFTALSSAIKSKSLEMTRILIAAGARINTTLNRHTNSRFPEITDFLKENLSVILYESITKNQIDTFFNIISFYREWHPRNLPWLKDLMDKTLDLAIRENNPLVITKLAKSKLDLNSPRLNLVDSKNGMTPLTKSISENNEEMFWALIEVGANTGKANGHDEAIDYVTRNTKPKIVVGLLKEIDILKINHGTKKILFQIPGIKELHDDAQRLNEILGQNSKLPKNLNQKEIREVIEIMERNQENIAVFDNIDEPKNRSILARCFLHIKSPAVIKEFIAHLPSFITKKNLTKPDYKQRIPLHLAMARAFDNEAFIPIASKLAAIMVIDNPELDITKYFPARKLTMTEKTYRSIAVKIITATSEDRERKQELPFDSFENDEIKEEKKMTIIHAKPDIKKAKSKALKSKGLVGLENKDK